MRSNYILYIVGIALLAVAGCIILSRDVLEVPMGGMLIYSAIVFVLVLFGITFFVFGYGLRPKKQKAIYIPSQPVETLIGITQVKGIGKTRAEQLKTLGITTIADLSSASAEELANKLQVSSKVTSQWVAEARKQFLKPEERR